MCSLSVPTNIAVHAYSSQLCMYTAVNCACVLQSNAHAYSSQLCTAVCVYNCTQVNSCDQSVCRPSFCFWRLPGARQLPGRGPRIVQHPAFGPSSIRTSLSAPPECRASACLVLSEALAVRYRYRRNLVRGIPHECAACVHSIYNFAQVLPKTQSECMDTVEVPLVPLNATLTRIVW